MSDLPPDLATLFQIQYRLEAIISGVAALSVAVAEAVGQIDMPDVAATDMGPVLAALGRLEQRMVNVEQAVLAPKVRDVVRDDRGVIVRTIERTVP